MTIEQAKADPYFWLCMVASVRNSELIENYCRLRGIPMPAKSPIGRMIDEATGIYDNATYAGWEEFVFQYVYLLTKPQPVPA